MDKIALTLPGTGNIIEGPPELKAKGLVDLGSVLSGFLNIAFYAAFFLAFFYLIWAAFSYITAQGKKEELQKATARITYAIVGLIIIFLAYFIAQFAGNILKPQGGLPF